jgi:hypothetical protein
MVEDEWIMWLWQKWTKLLNWNFLRNEIMANNLMFTCYGWVIYVIVRQFWVRMIK